MRSNLHQYKYQGGDSGIMWKYFYNPASKRLVEFLPEWLAPNLITLFGFIVITLPFAVLFGCYGTHF